MTSELTATEAEILHQILVAARAAAMEGRSPGRGWLLDDLRTMLDRLPVSLARKVNLP